MTREISLDAKGDDPLDTMSRQLDSVEAKRVDKLEVKVVFPGGRELTVGGTEGTTSDISAALSGIGLKDRDIDHVRADIVYEPADTSGGDDGFVSDDGDTQDTTTTQSAVPGRVRGGTMQHLMLYIAKQIGAVYEDNAVCANELDGLDALPRGGTYYQRKLATLTDKGLVDREKSRCKRDSKKSYHYWLNDAGAAEIDRLGQPNLDGFEFDKMARNVPPEHQEMYRQLVESEG